jgi:hypothetical protein
MNLEFEGIAKSKASDRAGIKVEPVVGLWFVIDLDNSLSGGGRSSVAVG